MNKIILITFILISVIIISGFAASKITKEDESIEYVDFNFPTTSSIDLEELLHSDDKDIRETTEDIVQERKIDVKTYKAPERPTGRWVWAIVTAYEPSEVSCGEYADGKTSIGVDVMSSDPHKVYGFAVDPRMIPYGTRIHIEDYWNALQQNNNPDFRPRYPLKSDDTGSAMRRAGDRGIIHIDVRFRTLAACKAWGVRRMQVFIYD